MASLEPAKKQSGRSRRIAHDVNGKEAEAPKAEGAVIDVCSGSLLSTLFSVQLCFKAGTRF